MAVKERKGFMKWYFSPQGKKVVGCVYSLGAAVVIVGALFKILHWPGASIMLMIGMFTEAILFSIGVLDDPHPDLHWNHVFPQLTANEEDPLVNHLGGAGQGGGSSVEVLKDEDVKALSNGVKSIAQTAEKLSGLATVVGSVDALKQSMDNAAAETDKYVQSQSLLNTSSEKLSTSYDGISTDVEQVVAQTKVYLNKVEVVNKNLEAINGVYELQLNELRAQNDIVASQNKGLNTMTTTIDNVNNNLTQMQNLLEVAATEEQNFNKGVQELNTKVSNLNSIYGNMLNALS